LKFENVVFPDGIGFKCKNCGVCCREQPADTNPAEQKLIEEKGFTNFLEAPDRTDLRFIKRKKDGSCLFLTKDNKCEIYDVRPAICRIVPFFVTDYDYEKDIIEVDLLPEADCPEVYAGTDLPIEQVGKAAQAITKEMIQMVANRLKLPTTDKKVLSITRSILTSGAQG
jgi:Fe-S-cluster containining protein